MLSWGFALREGVFAENKEGICRNKDIPWIGRRLLSGKLPSCSTNTSGLAALIGATSRDRDGVKPKLMRSWGLALGEVVFAENKEGICRNKEKKTTGSFKRSRRARVKVPCSKQDKRLHGAASSWYRDYDTPRLVL